MNSKGTSWVIVDSKGIKNRVSGLFGNIIDACLKLDQIEILHLQKHNITVIIVLWSLKKKNFKLVLLLFTVDHC